ncbi:hypothetical protein QM806_36535 [Rhodococcus sp. IEGM 1351]|uniref:hypothetical protein n=1 Tax=Rhodococcus sp. IEGM 1351 TaxID=3047089 RepID=UPI0024B79351|nr:hypothetical protein [Rhodococcus sp. IEGM 1351]MDI9940870.1 hypothetical protein [Rhodococcus sp. IEGM 1351]
MRKHTVTKQWSTKFSRNQYRIKVEGFSTSLMFSESELAVLADNINQALGGTNDSTNHQ